jgi:chloramphenicol-sensitive protein RarD
VLVVLLSVLGRWRTVGALFRSPRVLAMLAASSALIASNWFVFIWAVSREKLLQASLGYFIGPLVTVALGFTVLRERLTRAEGVAVGLAAVAVAWLTASAGIFPWIALCLAGSFAMYGLVRKLAGVNAIEGLMVETTLLLPLATAYLCMLAASGNLAFGSGSTKTSLLLSSAGLITAFPLLWFAVAVRTLRLATLGVLQYVGPTLQMLLAVLVYHEPFGVAHRIAFALIWLALGIYTADNFRRAQQRSTGEIVT